MESFHDALTRLLFYSVSHELDDAVEAFSLFPREQIEQLYELPPVIRLDVWADRTLRAIEPPLLNLEEMRQMEERPTAPDDDSAVWDNAVRLLEDDPGRGAPG